MIGICAIPRGQLQGSLPVGLTARPSLSALSSAWVIWPIFVGWGAAVERGATQAAGARAVAAAAPRNARRMGTNDERVGSDTGAV